MTTRTDSTYGATWIAANWRITLSPLGENVANLLDEFAQGIYHLDVRALKKVQWDDDYCVRFIYRGDLATVDFNRLTLLVVRAHDRMLRVSLRGIGPGYIEMLFHQRERRDGAPSIACPSIETHLAKIRSVYDTDSPTQNAV